MSYREFPVTEPEFHFRMPVYLLGLALLLRGGLRLTLSILTLRLPLLSLSLAAAGGAGRLVGLLLRVKLRDSDLRLVTGLRLPFRDTGVLLRAVRLAGAGERDREYDE